MFKQKFLQIVLRCFTLMLLLDAYSYSVARAEERSGTRAPKKSASPSNLSEPSTRSLPIEEPTSEFELDDLALPKSLRAGETHRKEGRNISDCFNAALKKSEVMSSQLELISQEEERLAQAEGARILNVGATASYMIQGAGDDPTKSSYSPSAQPLVKVSADQPLFRGFREFATIKKENILIQVRGEEWRAASIQLYRDVATSFYRILSLETDLINLDIQIGIYEKWIKELSSRIKIGRSRLTESLTIRAAVKTLQAQAEVLRGQIGVARQTMAFLTGFDTDIPLWDSGKTPSRIDSLNKYLSETENRPDVKQEIQKSLAAIEETHSVEGIRMPSVDLYGNYYLLRSGVNKGVSWDLQLALTLPIFTGGIMSSQIKESVSKERSADLALSRTRRLALQEVRSEYELFQADLRALESLKQATEISEKNYKEQTREYRLGLVTNIEVLQAITAFQDNKRAVDRTTFSLKSDYAGLEAAAARKPKLRVPKTNKL